MMDEIAGHVGFYEPIFHPAYNQACEGAASLKFKTVDSVIRTAFPAASFQATLFACVRRMTTPVVYLEAELAYKKDVKRRLRTPSLFGDDEVPGELRAVEGDPQIKAAQQDGFTIPTNMRVPANSVIHRLFNADSQTTDSAGEDFEPLGISGENTRTACHRCGGSQGS